MNQKIQQCFMVEAKKPSLAKSPVGGIPVKEGKNFPNSEKEDVGGFSLNPIYSRKQLRKIKRLRIRQAEIVGNWYLQTLKNGGRLRW